MPVVSVDGPAPKPFFWKWVTAGPLALIGLLSMAGCQKVDEVAVYTVAKPPAAVKPRKTPPPVRPVEPRTAPADGPSRILAAVVPHGAQTWFFKLTGPSAAVVAEAQPFLDFVKSLHFEGETPRWTAPDGWTERPGNQFRFATLVIDGESGPLELSVSPLPTAEGEFDAYLLSNINRWRNQLKAPPLTAADLEKAAVKIDLEEITVWLVNIEGRLGPEGMGAGGMGAKGMGQGTPAREPQDRPSTPAGLPPLPLTFKLPDGWVRKPAGPMRMAEFEARDGERKVVVSISTAGGDLLANVNRWRGQIALDPIDAGQLNESMKKIDAAGVSADYVELIGPESASAPQTILGVIAPVGDRQWFLKLQGDSALAKREQPNFEAFVKSIRLPGSGEGTHGQ
jgi:hypothetical protein